MPFFNCIIFVTFILVALAACEHISNVFALLLNNSFYVLKSGNNLSVNFALMRDRLCSVYGILRHIRYPV